MQKILGLEPMEDARDLKLLQAKARSQRQHKNNMSETESFCKICQKLEPRVNVYAVVIPEYVKRWGHKMNPFYTCELCAKEVKERYSVLNITKDHDAILIADESLDDTNSTALCDAIANALNGMDRAIKTAADRVHTLTDKRGGRIDVIAGPMFSGKTTELFRRITRQKLANRRCQLLGYSGNNRSGDPRRLETHDKHAVMVDMVVERLYDAKEACLKADVIGIDEGQFFGDLAQFCDEMATVHGKLVIVAALNSNFERKPWPQVSELVALAETITKLNAVCEACRSEASEYATFSQLRSLPLPTSFATNIGGKEKYKAVCRSCYGARKK